LKSEEESSRHSSSFSWENEETVNEQPSIEKKPSDIDKEMGALDSMMFQKKGLGQLKNAKPPPDVETGLTTNSEYSDHSSYSSDDNTNDLPPNKSMGPVWQKAIDNAQKALHSKSDKKSKGLVLVDDDSVADDDTVFSVKPGFNRERLQSVGKHKSITSSSNRIIFSQCHPPTLFHSVIWSAVPADEFHFCYSRCKQFCHQSIWPCWSHISHIPIDGDVHVSYELKDTAELLAVLDQDASYRILVSSLHLNLIHMSRDWRWSWCCWFHFVSISFGING
jgi:hypothetical protein